MKLWCISILGFYVMVALSADLLFGADYSGPVFYSPEYQDKMTDPLLPPNQGHLLGTDLSRRDVFARLAHGTRTALWVGVLAMAIALPLGAGLGLFSGFYVGLTDSLISRGIDVFLGLPPLLWILVFMALIRRPELWHTIVILGLLSWVRIAKTVRAETLRLRQMAFVEAAWLLDLSDLRIMLQHILPNLKGPLSALLVFGFGGAILNESALALLGFGPDVASFGNLLRHGMQNPQAFWLLVFPAIALFFLLWPCTVLADLLTRDK